MARRLNAPFCRVCSAPFAGEIDGELTCADCAERRFAFDCAVSRYRHRGVVQELIVRFKYRRQHYLRQPLGQWLAECLDDERLRRQPADALVPVPLHPRRWRERGFNQAEELCRMLSPRARLPVWANVLRRVRYTETQTHFERAERLENLRGAFAVPPRRAPVLAGARLLLVDDVFTTGATVDECARVLRAAGAGGVRVLTVARA